MSYQQGIGLAHGLMPVGGDLEIGLDPNKWVAGCLTATSNPNLNPMIDASIAYTRALRSYLNSLDQLGTGFNGREYQSSGLDLGDQEVRSHWSTRLSVLEGEIPRSLLDEMFGL